MRRDPYEKIKMLLVTFGIIFVIAAIVTGIIFIGSRTAANKKHTAGNGNATGSVSESVPESGTQEEDFFTEDDNGILNGKKREVKQQLKEQESEEDNAPEVRDVSPDNDPNAIFPDIPSDVQPAEQEQQGQ